MATTPKKSAAKTAAASNEASFVKELADILDQAGLVELEYETEAVAIRLSRVTAAAPIAGPPACPTHGHPQVWSHACDCSQLYRGTYGTVLGISLKYGGRCGACASK